MKPLGTQRRTITAGDKKAATTLVQDTIDKGVTTVEDLHKSLADLPFKVLEASALASELLEGLDKRRRTRVEADGY